MVHIRDIVADFGGNDFLLPYFQRALGVTDDDEPVTPMAGIRIVSGSTEAEATEFEEFCRKRDLPVAVLQCPNIVGTGMTGLMRRIAAGIYKGSFVHIGDNDARISVVHATDVARAAAMAAGSRGSYVLTDGSDPLIHDLAEAFAYRMGDKRIFTIAPRWAKLWYGRDYFRTLTTTDTVADTFRATFPDFKPSEVVNYLKTHVYDQQSL